MQTVNTLVDIFLFTLALQFDSQTKLVLRIGIADSIFIVNKTLLEKLKALNEDDLKNATKKYLSGSEIKAVMARRDLIVAQFAKLASEKGDAAVYY